MSDCTIIKKLKRNNEKAIEELIGKYGQYIASVVYKVGGAALKTEDIEEVVSDVFYALWKARHNIAQTDLLKPYLAQIARNMTRNKYKNVREELPLEEDTLSFENKIDEMILQKEKIVMVKDFLDKMKQPDRDILTAYYFMNNRLEEISITYNLPLSTVKSKIYRGRKTIVECLKERGYSYEHS